MIYGYHPMFHSIILLNASLQQIRQYLVTSTVNTSSKQLWWELSKVKLTVSGFDSRSVPFFFGMKFLSVLWTTTYEKQSNFGKNSITVNNCGNGHRTLCWHTCYIAVWMRKTITFSLIWYASNSRIFYHSYLLIKFSQISSYLLLHPILI